MFATLLTASVAMADVTAQHVWNDWRALMAHTGAQIGFDQSASDGILAINNLSLTTKPQHGAATEINLGSLVFQEQSDGTVIVMLPNDAPIVVRRGDTKVTLNQSHKDLSLVVSGEPKDMTYSYRAGALALTLVELLVAGEKLTDASANVTLGGLNGTTQTRNANLLELIQDVTLGSLSYRLDFNHIENRPKSYHGARSRIWQTALP